MHTDQNLAHRIRLLRDTLSTSLVERDEPVRLALLAALAGEHLLLLGPPGTAKSLVARRLHLAFEGSAYFERLLTRFTVPEELFGPLSIKALENDQYQRLTASYLPEASIAFLDEIFKANSAILNALLTLLNEREFDNGATRVRTPLVAVVGASNELPEPGELDALYDRFLLRQYLAPVTTDAFPELLKLRGNDPPAVADDLRLTTADLEMVQTLAEKVELPEDVVALLCALRQWCAAESITVSDRRWRKVVKLLQVSALTNGRDHVHVWDCWLLQHCIWNLPDDKAKVYEWYAERVGASAAMDPSKLVRVVSVWEGKLKSDRESRSQMRNAKGQLLYVGPKGNTARERVQKTREKLPLYLAPANASFRQWSSYDAVDDRTNGGKGFTRVELGSLFINAGNTSPRMEFEHWKGRDAYLSDESNWLMDDPLSPAMEPTRQKSAYVQSSIAQVEQLRTEMDEYRLRLQAHMATLDEEIRTHLWMSPDFAGTAAQTLKRTAEQVEGLLTRVIRLREGYEALPREPEAAAHEGLHVLSDNSSAA